MTLQRNLYELQIFEYINNMRNRLNIAPVVLGGYTASGGGKGGPPGGFVGVLPQTSVAYDLSEISASGTPASGESLLDNLNHIRYRLTALEIPGGIAIYQDNTLVTSGITVLDFHGQVDTILHAGGEANIHIHQHIVGEDLTSQVDGAVSGFVTTHVYIPNSLAVYYNGIREYVSNVVAYSGYKGFYLTYVPSGSDKLIVDYIYYTKPDALQLSQGETVIVSDAEVVQVA